MYLRISLAFQITEDYAKDYISAFESKRRSDIYENVDLTSIYFKKQRERMRLSGEFPKNFANFTTKRKLKNKLTMKPSKILNPIIADGKIVNVDKIGKVRRFRVFLR